MSTPHNNAKVGQIAKTVLMPGDPLRAEFIANTFLENPVLFNEVRGMKGYTGTYKGKEVSVMGSGMGMASIGIYSYELYSVYGVENIIRVGSAGSYSPDLEVYDVILASAAWSESTFAKVQSGYEKDIIEPSAELNEKLVESAKELGYEMSVGVIHSSDVFYREDKSKYYEVLLKEHGCEVVEMESFALFANAKALGKSAACILTVSDTFTSHVVTTAEERQNSFTKMMEIALEAAIK